MRFFLGSKNLKYSYKIKVYFLNTCSRSTKKFKLIQCNSDEKFSVTQKKTVYYL